MQPVSSQMSTSMNFTDTSADKTSAPISSTQVDTITQIPSSTNELQLTQKVSKQKDVKNIVTDGKRYFTRFQKKQKSGDNQVQETVKGKQKKKDLEMQIISKPLIPAAQAVTDRLYNEDKISKGGPFKKSGTKSTPKASKGRGRPKKKSLSE